MPPLLSLPGEAAGASLAAVGAKSSRRKAPASSPRRRRLPEGLNRVCRVSGRACLRGGGGGREHALADVLGRDHEVVVTPGNAAIPGSVVTAPEDLEADLFVVGPEAPLVDGLADRLRGQGRLVFGPGADGARLEGSKAWMKDVLAEAEVPTARYRSFTEVDPALEFLRSLAPPYVVKTDGLAAGKGVLVAEDLADAEADVREKLSGASFGAAGERVVIEEGLTGPGALAARRVQRHRRRAARPGPGLQAHR